MDSGNRQAPGVASGVHVVGAWLLAQDAHQQIAPLVEVGVGRECRDGRIVDLVFLDRDLDRGSLETIPIPADMPKVAGGFCSPSKPAGRRRPPLGLGKVVASINFSSATSRSTAPAPAIEPRAHEAFQRVEFRSPSGAAATLATSASNAAARILRDRRGIRRLPIPTRGLGLLRGPHLLGRALHEIRDQPVGRRTQGTIREHVLSSGPSGCAPRMVGSPWP